MNPTPQLAPHPDLPHLDAELINAFVEGALPAPERDQMMIHLAACTRCRQILYLAQDTAQDSAQLAFPVAAPFPAAKPSWFANWRFAWLPATACAALATLAIVVAVVRRTPQPASEIAANHQPAGQPATNRPSPQSNTVSTIAPSTPPPTTGAAPKTQISGDTPLRSKTSNLRPDNKDQTPEPSQYAYQNARQNAAQNTMRDEKQNTTQNALQAAAPVEANAQGLKSESTNGSMGVGGIAGGIAANQSQNVFVQAAPPSSNENVTVNASVSTVDVSANTALIEQQSEQTTVNNSMDAQSLQELPLKGRSADALSKSKRKKKNGAASASSGSAGSVIAQAAPAAPAIAPGPVSAQDKAAPAGQSAGSGAAFGALTAQSADDAAARKALYTPMPSGLAAISTAGAQHRTLAIDSAGALFLSEDDGKSWQPIAQQWTGRAVQLRVHPSSAAAATPFFELVTDSVSTWSSTDGKTWRRGLP